MSWQPIQAFIEGQGDFSDPGLYSSVLQAFGKATSLPQFAFRSKAFADFEDEKIWTRAWVCVGTALRIRNGGDLLPFTVGNHGIHIQREEGGSLKGFFNFAQHGGCRYVPRQCQTGRKTTCFYTSCGHSRDRDVILAKAGGPDPTETYMYVGMNPLKLLPVSVGMLGSLIFVNLDNACDAQSIQLGAMGEALTRHCAKGVRHAGHLVVESRCNWKLSGAAFFDVCPVIGLEDVKDGIDFSHWSDGVDESAFWGFNVELNSGFKAAQFGKKALDKLGNSGTISVFWIYPNLLLSVFDCWMITVVIQPAGLDETIHHCDFFRIGDCAIEDEEDEIEAYGGYLESWEIRFQASLNAVKAQFEASKEGENPPSITSQRRSDALLTAERNPLVSGFYKYFVARLLTSHEYIERTRYTNSGRSLNAGINSGVF
ncbi:MAG: hypothetical protein ACYC3O_01885 [Burkholderiales bacterium]